MVWIRWFGLVSWIGGLEWLPRFGLAVWIGAEHQGFKSPVRSKSPETPARAFPRELAVTPRGVKSERAARFGGCPDDRRNIEEKYWKKGNCEYFQALLPSLGMGIGDCQDSFLVAKNGKELENQAQANDCKRSRLLTVTQRPTTRSEANVILHNMFNEGAKCECCESMPDSLVSVWFPIIQTGFQDARLMSPSNMRRTGRHVARCLHSRQCL